ncbi:hypothetical protein AB4170_23845 [Vibrio splendidus]
MILKISKSHNTFDMNRKKEFSEKDPFGSFAYHLMYLIVDKKTGLLSKKRFDFGTTFKGLDLTEEHLLKEYGHLYDKSKIKQACNDIAIKYKEYINDTYINVPNSKKSKFLDEHGESTAVNKNGTPEIFHYKGVNSFEKEEYKKIVDKFNGDMDQVKDYILLIAKDSVKELYNTIKKEQGIKVKTKISDVELLYDFHLDHDNPHIHWITHAYDPTSKLFMNGRNFSQSKKLAHEKIEVKYKDVLSQGVAAGYAQKEALEAKEKFLQAIKNKGFTDTAAAQRLSQIEEQIQSVMCSTKHSTFESKQEALKLLGITISEHKEHTSSVPKGSRAKGKKTMIYKIDVDGFEQELYSNSFIDNKRLQTSFAKIKQREFFEQDTKKIYGNNSDYGLDKIETVLKHNKKQSEDFVKVKIKNESQNGSVTLSPDRIKEIKQEGFKLFCNRNADVGIISRLNNKGHLNYYKISSNDKGAAKFKAKNYKASLFNDTGIQGKSLMKDFSIDNDLIEEQQIYFQQFIAKKKYADRNMVYIFTDVDTFNDTFNEAYRINQFIKLFEKVGLRSVETNDGHVLLNKFSEAVFSVESNENGGLTFINSGLNDFDSAKYMYNSLLENMKNEDKDKKFRFFMEGENDGSRDFYITAAEIIFSSETSMKNLRVDHDINDPNLQKEIERKLDYQLNQYNNNFKRQVKKQAKKGSFNFTNAYGIHLLENEHLNVEQNERIANQLNDKIADLVNNHNVEIDKITIDKKPIDTYISEHRKEINRLIKIKSDKRPNSKSRPEFSL